MPGTSGNGIIRICMYLEPEVTAFDMCVPGASGNGTRFVVYLEPPVKVLDMWGPGTSGNGIRYVFTWNQR